MDDTNPAAEDQEYVDAIKAGRSGSASRGMRYYAADYFGQIYAWAERLVEKGLAYVDDQDADAIAASRGTLTTRARNSPCRDRAVAENSSPCCAT